MVVDVGPGCRPITLKEKLLSRIISGEVSGFDAKN